MCSFSVYVFSRPRIYKSKGFSEEEFTHTHTPRQDVVFKFVLKPDTKTATVF